MNAWANNSRDQTFQTCPRLYYYEYEIGLGSGPKYAADFGSGLHAALEAYYGLGEPAFNLPAAITALRSAIDWDRQNEVADQKGEVFHTLGYAEALLTRYDQVQRHEDERTIKRILKQEHAGKAVIGSAGRMGRLDMLVEHQDGTFWIWDHKTLSGRASLANYITTQRLSYQHRLYRSFDVGVPVKGTVINILRKLVIPSKKRQKTIQGVKEVWTEPQMDEWQPFYREKIHVNDRLMDEYGRELPLLEKWKNECRETGIWPQNAGACTKFNRLCEFHELCLGGVFFEDDWEAREPDYVDEANNEGERA